LIKQTRKLVLGSVILLFCSIGANSCFAQLTDLARLEYTYIPQGNSDNVVTRFRVFANYPIQLGWEGSFLIPGVEYRNLNFDIDDPMPFDLATLGSFQSFRASLAYTFKMKRNWRFGAKVGLEVASNFEESTVESRDMRFSGEIYMIKDRTGDEFEKPNRLILGLQYSTNAGRPFPIPIINYFRRFHPDWSYSLGSPKTNLKHTFGTTQKHSLQSYVTLDGFFSNIQNDLVITNPDNSITTADNISMTIILGGLGYEYSFTKHLLFYFYGGHTIFNEIRLRDRSRNNLFTINEENTFYLRSGIKFKI